MLHARHIGQNVDAAETLGGEIHQLPAVLPLCQVAHEGNAAQLAGGLPQQRLVDIRHDHLRAFLPQRLRHGVANAAGSAGDNGDLIV